MKKGNDLRRIKDEYIYEFKFLFPDIQKEERQYLQGPYADIL